MYCTVWDLTMVICDLLYRASKNESKEEIYKIICDYGCSLLFFSAETPIEEFTPTPAFPALQYLESVDVEGVAWRAGLRTGDFLIEVNKDSSSFASLSVSYYWTHW